MAGDTGQEVVEYGAVALGYRYRSAVVLRHEEEDTADDDTPIPPRAQAGQPGTGVGPDDFGLLPPSPRRRGARKASP